MSKLVEISTYCDRIIVRPSAIQFIWKHECTENGKTTYYIQITLMDCVCKHLKCFDEDERDIIYIDICNKLGVRRIN